MGRQTRSGKMGGEWTGKSGQPDFLMSNSQDFSMSVPPTSHSLFITGWSNAPQRHIQVQNARQSLHVLQVGPKLHQSCSRQLNFLSNLGVRNNITKQLCVEKRKLYLGFKIQVHCCLSFHSLLYLCLCIEVQSNYFILLRINTEGKKHTYVHTNYRVKLEPLVHWMVWIKLSRIILCHRQTL